MKKLPLFLIALFLWTGSSWGQVTTFPYTEGFEAAWSGTPWAPPNWSQINVSGNHIWLRHTETSHSGSCSACVYYGPYGDDNLLITPGLNFGTTDYRLKFWLMHTVGSGSSTGSTDLKVQIADDNSSAGNFTTTLATYHYPGISSTMNWTECIIDLSAYEGIQYIAFRQIDDYGVSLYIDDVTIEEIPSCTAPTDLNSTTVTTTGADLGWTDASGSYWDLYIVAAGDPAPNAGSTPTVNDITSNPYTWTGGMASTSYDWYVRSDCGQNNTDVSTWTGPEDFTTACAATTAPWSDDFEDHTATITANWGECWTASPSITITEFRWNLDASGSTPSSSTGPDAAYSGSKYAYTEASEGNTGDFAELYTPYIDIDGLTNPAISFYYYMYGADMGNLYVDVHNGTSWNNGVFSVIGQQQTSGSQPWLEGFVDISAYSGTIQIRFRGEKGNSYKSDIAIDDISVYDAPTPVQSIPFTEGWESGTIGSAWDYNAGSVSTIEVNGASKHEGTYGLEQYGNSSSSYATPSNLADAYTKSQTGGANEAWTTWNQFSVDLSSSSSPWLSFWYAMGYEYNNNYNNFWVQVSTNGTNWTDLFSTQTNNAAIPYEKKVFNLDAYNGTSQLYIRFFHNGKYNTNYLYLDDISVEEVSCPQPSDLTESNIDSGSADLGWTETGSATTWNIEYGETGFTQGTGTVISGVTTNPFSLTGLASATTYDWYVQADCGGEVSDWTGPDTFTTFCTAIDDFSENFDVITPPAFPGCWSKIGTTGSAQTQTSDPYSSPNCLHLLSNSTTSIATVSLPPVSNLGAGSHRLSFYMRANYTVGGIVEFGYLTDPSDAATFVSLGSATAASKIYSNYTITPVAGTYSNYPALRHTGSPAYSLLIDNVIWEENLTPNPATLSFPTEALVTLNNPLLSWTPAATGEPATGYRVYMDDSNPPTTEVYDGTDTEFQTTGLSLGTTYYWKVVPYNATGDAAGVSVWSFTTVAGGYLAESFEGSTFPPTGWANPGSWQRSDVQYYEGVYSAYQNTTATEALLRTPLLTLTSNSTLDFFAKTATSNTYQRIQVAYSSDGSAWTDIGSEISLASAGDWASYSVDLGSLDGNNYYVGIIAYNTSSSGQVYVDHVIGPMIAVVPDAVSLVTPADEATNQSITPSLSWTAAATGGAPTGYKIYLDENTDPTTLYADVTASPYTVSPALDYSTTYYWKVLAYNGSGDGAASEVWSFTTMDYPTISTFPYSESFDDATFAPAGWKNVKTAGGSTPGIWDRQTTGTNPDCTPHSGAGMARYDCYTLLSGTKGELITPSITFPDDNYYVSFWMYRDNGYSSYSNEVVNVYYNTSATSTGGTLLGTVHRVIGFSPVVSSTGWYKYSFTMPTGATGSGRYLIFEGVSQYGNNIFVDDVAIDVIPNTYWSGASNVDWHTIANWDYGVPSASTNVIIPSGLTNYPTISSSAACNNLTIESDASGDGSLLGQANLTVNGTTTIERYTTNSMWHGIAGPLDNDDFHTFYLDDDPQVWAMSYDESDNGYDYVTDLNTDMGDAKGWMVWVGGSTPQTFAFTGDLRTGTVGPVALTNSVTGSSDYGYNFVGNPYPSAIDWDASSGWTLTNVDAGIWVYNASSGNFDTYNVIGGTGGGSRYIAMGQGFFVQVNSASGSGELTMTTDVQVHNTVDFKARQTSTPHFIKLQLTDGTRTDESIIHLNVEASAGYDGQLDMHKMFSWDDTYPQLYSTANSGMAINSLPPGTASVDMNVRGDEGAKLTLSLTEVYDFDEVYVQDNKNEMITNLMRQPYEFIYDASFRDRFTVFFTTLVGDEEMVHDPVTIYAFDHTLRVVIPTDTNTEITVNNALGQLVIQQETSQGVHDIRLEQRGTYVVRVLSSGQVTTRKIIIR